MINAFGCGFSEGYGNDFDITKLRYDKIMHHGRCGRGRGSYLHAAFDIVLPVYAGADLRGACVYRHAASLQSHPGKRDRKSICTMTRHWSKYRKTHNGSLYPAAV